MIAANHDVARHHRIVAGKTEMCAETVRYHRKGQCRCLPAPAPRIQPGPRCVAWISWPGVDS